MPKPAARTTAALRSTREAHFDAAPPSGTGLPPAAGPFISIGELPFWKGSRRGRLPDRLEAPADAARPNASRLPHEAPCRAALSPRLMPIPNGSRLPPPASGLGVQFVLFDLPIKGGETDVEKSCGLGLIAAGVVQHVLDMLLFNAGQVEGR